MTIPILQAELRGIRAELITARYDAGRNPSGHNLSHLAEVRGRLDLLLDLYGHEQGGPR